MQARTRARRVHVIAAALGCVLLLASLLASVGARPANAAAAPAGAPGPGEASGKIVNGSRVEPDEYAVRWGATVALVAQGVKDPGLAHFCGGILVAPTIVLTAAHCVTTPRFSFPDEVDVAPGKSLEVLVGKRRLSDTVGARVKVRQVNPHPEFYPPLLTYDAAILTLREPVRGIAPVPVVAPGEEALWGAGNGRAVDAGGPHIAGWGNRSSGTGSPFELTPPNLPDTLWEASVPIKPDSVCEDGGPGQGQGYGRLFVPSTMMCAGVLDSRDLNDLNQQNTGVDSCNGDSGGPMTAALADGSLRVIGLTSWGFTCAARQQYGVYTKAAVVRDWVYSSPPAVVRNVEDPAIEGEPVPGELITCDVGLWKGGGKIRYRFRWERTPTEDELRELLGELEQLAEGEGEDEDVADVFLPVEGATKQRYRVRRSDAGRHLRCIVTARNESSHLSERSEPTATAGAIGGIEVDADFGSKPPPSPPGAGDRLRHLGTRCAGRTCAVRLATRGQATRVTTRVVHVASSGRRVRLGARVTRQGAQRWTITVPRRRGLYSVAATSVDQRGRSLGTVRFAFAQRRTVR